MTSEKQRRGHRSVIGISPSHRQQCLQVRFACTCETHDFRVYDLLSRKPALTEQPPDGGMKPEAGSNQFFTHIDQPIVVKNVEELVAKDRALSLVFQRQK